MNRHNKRIKSFIGADIGGGFFAADVLLASSEREAESAAAFGVKGFSGEPARHLAHEFFTRRDDANERPAVARRNAKTLRFERDDVCVLRRLHNSERNGLRDAINKQRSGGVGAFCKWRELFKHSEEIRRLHHDRGGFTERSIANGIQVSLS